MHATTVVVAEEVHIFQRRVRRRLQRDGLSRGYLNGHFDKLLPMKVFHEDTLSGIQGHFKTLNLHDVGHAASDPFTVYVQQTAERLAGGAALFA